jgi:O-acetylhomoserine/O-acetylserine sulfhydrylase-like pyridoxal-dependent enzyme
MTGETNHDLTIARQISPRRTTTGARGIDELVAEQLVHFGLVEENSMRDALARLAGDLYRANIDLHDLWRETMRTLGALDRRERIAYFNAKRFLCFQLAKLLDNLQNPFRRVYQSLMDTQAGRLNKGPYPIFDNVTAVFSATPTITRTATYLYACTEWVDQAFQGREMLLEVYSRLLNPTSISLANHIVDLECGPHSHEYMAWNFNSGMAAVDATLANVLGYQDIVLASRNVYGGVYQLLHDWYCKPSNLDVAVEFFDGYTDEAFRSALADVSDKYRARLDAGRHIYVYLESPCNPRGYVLDVPAICRAAHQAGLILILDSTVATPFLSQPLLRPDNAERPDFVIHSYTKDITGSGTTTAGCVIARNERMFLSKGESLMAPGADGRPQEFKWNETLFWNVYYIKGAFLDADKAFEVITGSRTLELRMLRKAVGTLVLARFLASHPAIAVQCNALEDNENAGLRQKILRWGLPAPLFTIDFEQAGLDRAAFTRFFDSLEPAFGQQVSLGQCNTVVLCPALTSHSELSANELRRSGITPTTVRISVGDEDPRLLIAHFIRAAELIIDPVHAGFSQSFMPLAEVDQLYRQVYLNVHSRWLDGQPGIESMAR